MKGEVYQLGRGLILRLEHEGIHGYGEIAPLPGFSKETLGQAFSDLMRALKTGNLLDLCPSVSFALTSALAQIRSPLKPAPLLVKRKIKLGHLSPIKAASLIVQEEKPLRVDINRKWTLSEALFFANQFPPGTFEYIEEPTNKLADTIAFAKMTHHPIALDEHVREHPMHELQDIPNLRAFIIKPSIQAGYLSYFAQTKVPCILSSGMETLFGIQAIGELAQRLRLPPYPHGLLAYQKILPLDIRDNHLHFQKLEIRECNARYILTQENIPETLLS